MHEDYLQQLWRDKRLPFHQLKPINASTIEIIDVGLHNEAQKGPDFSLGCVKIDGVLFHGQIEVHVKSSDWYKHNHHSDNLYNGVILHVVYEYDKPVYQNNYLLPTVELKDIIDMDHYKKSIKKFIKIYDFPCAKLIHDLDPVFLEVMKNKMVTQRLDSKLSLVKELNCSDASVFYHLLANAFGTSINKHGFLELIRKVPLEELSTIKTSKERYRLIMAESGLAHMGNETAHSHLWHFKGTRPKNFPTVRVKQFAAIAAHYDFDTAFLYLSSKDLLDEFKQLIKRTEVQWHLSTPKFSIGMIEQLIINAVVPLLWYKAEQSEDDLLRDKAIDLLELLPAENNSVMAKWKRLNIIPKNSFDSQGLLGLYNYYCCRKKCLDCEVGFKLIGKT